MKLTKVIILIFLLVKSTIGFGGIAALVSLDFGCCSDKMELDESISQDQDQEEERGCCGDNCDCTCCTLGLIPLYTIEQKNNKVEVYTSNVTAFNTIYQHLFNNGVWQPPRLV